jgi:hypothetical protein
VRVVGAFVGNVEMSGNDGRIQAYNKFCFQLRRARQEEIDRFEDFSGRISTAPVQIVDEDDEVIPGASQITDSRGGILLHETQVARLRPVDGISKILYTLRRIFTQ